ncbi:CoA-binding protein, partial [Candidatus Gracilibacteria bacterium]|nr:CoA-binding protein [Candidatus Gracilibacteria bacterium]
MNFFDIASVAIIGTSETPGKIGNDLLKNMSDFEGAVYGVNPKYKTPNPQTQPSPPAPLPRGEGSIGDIQMYPDISSLPEVPDIAVFAIPASFVAESLKACGEKGIKRVIIISAGFKEIGNVEGEQELRDIAKQYDIGLLGPNCLGYIDTSKSLNLSFGGKDIRPGNIALVSQSGAMAVAFTDWAYEYGLGFSKIISMGNKADLNENDFLQQLAR